jgi:cell division protein ZapA (FtsZ GTPase activity inhibitor)
MAEIREHNAAYDKQKIAILSALNIAGELFEYKSKNEAHEKQLGELERKAEVLTRKIDVAL